MHGGQAIPAFDFYLAPYVRMSYQEEVKNLEKLTGEDLSNLYDAPIDDYIEKPLDGLAGPRTPGAARHQQDREPRASGNGGIHPQHEHHPQPRR